ncbi:hypothetical protein PX699_03315 [Sphingobium sp. H39-3-25]|uniref:hypothetical protein n=1 Tax=Sphingobium arseniciresistens TaxID=3030834 RepID=UPI0023B8F1A9|nr:hypothetical protein [Sphingobium arseniciresistens]
MPPPFPEPITFKRPLSWRLIMVTCCLLIPVAIVLATLATMMVYFGIKEVLAGPASATKIMFLCLFGLAAAAGWGFTPFILWQMRYWKTPLAIVNNQGLFSPVGRRFISWSSIENFFVWSAQGHARLTIQVKALEKEGGPSGWPAKQKRQIHFWIGSNDHPLVEAVQCGLTSARASHSAQQCIETRYQVTE